MKKRRTLQASFNLADNFEVGLLEHALTQGDVSKYIKRLIYVDKEGFRSAVAVSPAVPVAQETDVILDAMNAISL